MNASKSTKFVEITKSMLLVVLFLFTILLLYFFWGDTPLKNLIRDNPQQHESLNPAALLKPDYISVCLGGGSHTLAPIEFNTIMDCFRLFSEGGNLSVEAITKEAYDKAVAYPSLRAAFTYYVPFSVICEIYGIDRISGSDAIDALSELAYVSDSDELLYVADKIAGKHFKVIGSRCACFETLKTEISNAEVGNAMYFTLSTYIGGGSNNALCPVSFASAISGASYSLEDFSKPNEKAGGIVKSFFSDNFDFVRQIREENGAVIYMYGHGRTVVTANVDGTLEYKREEDGRASGQGRYFDALEKACAFVSAHSAFQSIDGIEFTPCIKGAVVNPGGKRGYRFIFGIETNGYKIYYQAGAPVTVDVVDGRVSYLKRDLVNVRLGDLDGAAASREVFPAFDLLWVNLDYMAGVITELQQEGLMDMSFESLVEMVTRFDCGYLKSSSDKTILEAVWVVTLDGLEFFFGLDDGNPLGWRVN